MHWLARQLLQHFIWLSVLSTSLLAIAHTSPGYVQCSLAEDAITLRLTMNLTTLSDLSQIDKNQDGELEPGEIAEALPLIRDHLKTLVKLYLNDQETAIGELSGANALWPSERPIRERDGLSSDACFIDLVFKIRAQQVFDSVVLEFGALLNKCQNLQDLECSLSSGSTEKAKQKADRGSSLVRWKLDSKPAGDTPAPGALVADSPSIKNGLPVRLTVVSCIALSCFWFWLLQKRKASKSPKLPES